LLRLIALDLGKRRARGALTAIGIAIGVAAIVALLALTSGLERSASGLINLGGAEMGLFQSGVTDLTASTLPEALIERVQDTDGVADAEGVSVLTTEVDGDSLLVFGVPPDSFVMRRLVVVDGRRPGPAEAMVGDSAAREHGLAVGDDVEVEDEDFQVAGIYHAGVPFEDQGIALQHATVQRLTDRAGEATTIAVAVDPGAETDAVADRLEETIEGTVAISEPGQVARVDTNLLLVQKSAVVIVALAIAIGALAAMNTMLLAVVERQREFALLSAIGWDSPRVARLVLTEGLLLGIAGAAIGLLAGIGGAAVAADALVSSELVTPHVTAWSLVRGALIGIGIGVVGGLYPAWRATRLPVAETLAD
jgi:putative ABC transport system permease protein